MKKVKFKILDDDFLDDHKAGDKINAFIFIEGIDHCLLYFPPCDLYCGYFTIAKKVGKYYESIRHEDNYINVSQLELERLNLADKK